jgi:hypothetical protein
VGEVKYMLESERGSMKALAAGLSTLLLAGSALAADDAVRAKLTGKWQSDGNGDSTWTLKEMGDTIHVTNSSPTGIIVEFDCNTGGRECEIKHGGHKSKVALWFNGPKLVEMETMGTEVVKRRFTVTGSGDTMDLETIPLVPGGPNETTHFKRTSSNE